MEFQDVVQARRSVREYRAEPPPAELISRLIHTALLAPSAMNRQPWAFAVVRGVERIDALGQRAKRHLLTSAPALPPDTVAMLNRTEFSLFHRAPVLILVLARSEDRQSREDCCLAAQTLMLAARDADLGTCWIGFAESWLDLATTKTELGVLRGYHVVAPIVMGHVEHWPESHGRIPPEIHWLE
ncbi:MAG: nitroreductase family protein [Pseudomonadota bacterium]